ncbi:MAG: molecular chaperone DnaJ [Candidatus Makana argininalis]
MSKLDYYEILGVSRNSENREIKKAYKRLAMKFHPDRNLGNKQAESKFKEIKEAYEILKDPQKRSTYDQYGHSAFEQNSNVEDNSDFGDIFGDVFGDIFSGNKRQKVRRGSDLQYNIQISLEESVKGVIKEIRIKTFDKCNFCNGSGAKSKNSIINCSSCNGNGQIHTRQGFFTVQQTCPYCMGCGTVIKNTCIKCNNGRIEKLKMLSVKIPSGVDSGDRIRLTGKGEAGEYGIDPGDLYVQINIKKHPIFEREENNLYCEIPINFTKAALGGEIEIPTLYGKLKLKIPLETQTGKIFRIRGKGVKSLRGVSIGDLLCKIVVETPVKLNNYQKKLLFDLEKSFYNSYENNNIPKSKKFIKTVEKFFDNIQQN